MTEENDMNEEEVYALPVSFGQQRLWFLSQWQKGSAVYNIPVAFRAKGFLNVPVLQRALDEIVRRHETLRTTFSVVEGEPLQVVRPPEPLPLDVVDLSHLPADVREREARRRADEEARRPFDLETDRVLRARILRLGPEDHLLVLTFHHIAFDAWSVGVFVRELAALYAAFAQGHASPLPERPIQYADYAIWQRELLQGEALEAQLSHWRRALAGVPVLSLPTDRPRPAVQSFRGARRDFMLPQDLSKRLRDLARHEGTTLFMPLLAAFQALLHRWSGQDDVAVGTPVAGRGRAETEDLIGFFVNTLVMRADLSGDPTFRDLLARVKASCLGAYAHQDVPFEKVVEDLAPERDLSHAPLFQVMFTLQTAAGGRLDLPGLALAQESAEAGASKFDLTLVMQDGPEGIAGQIEYATDLFDAETIGRMATHLETLLQGIVADPDTPVSRLPILPGAERDLLTSAWNDRAARFPAEATIHETFERQAQTHPARTAVTFEGSALTYAELNAKANQLAHRLKSLGVGPETLVALCLDRSLDMVVAILGVLKAGGAYVPIDPNYPADRIAFTIEDAKAPVVVTTTALSDRVPTASHVVMMDRDAATLAAEPASNPESGATASSLAYVIYTSGSTGRPKGVLIEHRHVARLFTATDKWFGFGADDVWTLFHSYAFDFSVWEIWGALLYGGRLVVVPQALARDADAFHALLRRERVTVLNQTPSAFRQLVRADASAPDGLSLRYVVFGGEALETASLKPWFDRHGDKTPQLVNMYGITETTVHVTYRLIDASDAERGHVSPIGRPIPDLQVYVLDAHRNPVPVGVAGEMYVGGAGVARGYLDRAALTAERFVRDPWAPGQTLYRSGDLARFRADGSLEYLGRIDHQVKIRGFRIELGEIESALARHPALREAVVIAREDAPGEKRLVAYLVPRAEAPTVAELRDHLKLTLPEYMVPSAFVPMRSIPLTPNGKVDRKALPAPEGESLSLGTEHVAPRTPIEETLAAIFRGVLAAERIGVKDNFFALGGHSLLATQVVSRVRDELEVELPLQTLFESPTVEGLAQAIETERARGGGVAAPPIRPVPREKDVPLSFAQQRLWFLDQWEPNSPAYNIPAALRLRGQLDAKALARTLSEILRRHEALRTVFREVDGTPSQVVLPHAPLALDVEDLQALPEEDREPRARALALAEGQRPFALSTGPLVRARLLRLGGDDHVLLLTFHHIVFDGWSTGNFLRELAAIYAAYAEGKPSPLAELDVQYPDFAAWQREWLGGGALEAQMDYWRRQLAGVSVLELPTDRPRPHVATFSGAGRSLPLPPATAARIRALCRSEGVTPFMPMLAAFQALLRRYSGQDDIAVGSLIAGRNRAEIEALIGFFVNTHVLRTDLSGNPTFRELLDRVKAVCFGAYAHQDVPFEKLVDELKPDRDLSRTPLFQVMFAHQNVTRDELALPGLDISALPTYTGATKFELNIQVVEEGDAITVFVAYNRDLFEETTIERLLAHYAALLDRVAADPAQHIDEVDLLPESERRRVTTEWHGPALDYPRELTLHDAFAAQAARTPDRPAVVFESTSLTFAQLDQRANRVAHRLQAMGARAGSLVGLCMERSTDVLVGLLGILKAGAAYVPIDPAYPAERVAFMLADAAAPVLVTQQHLLARLPSLPSATLCLDADAALIDAMPSTAPPHEATADSPAYVIYTSGSTGKPKGVVVGHRSPFNLLAGLLRDAYGPTIRRLQCPLRATLNAPLSFDASVKQLVLLLDGHALHVVGDRLRRDPGAFAAFLAEHRIDAFDCTPAQLGLLLDTGILDSPDAPSLALVGGEAIDPALWSRLAASPRTSFHNVYGPTECTVDATIAEIRAHPRPTIGRPLPNVRVYVLDGRGEPSPIGVPGELHIGGAGVAHGYHDRPDLTAEKFVPDPFAGAGARMYRTGDLARWLPDGRLDFLGRADHQVKVRGYRMELGEIESALRDVPGVREAAVIVREDTPGDRRLVAYVVGQAEGAGADAHAPQALRETLRKRLPDYMVPSAFVALPKIPLTPNFKLDRKALPAPEAERRDVGATFVAPRTPAESLLAAIWGEVLHREGVGVQDNFFDLGGDSILSIQVVARANARGLRLTPKLLFQHPTVEELAAVAGEGPSVEAEQGIVTGPAPLTPIQQAFFARDLPDRHHYNQSMLLRVAEPSEPRVLAEAWSRLVAHHDALRLRFEPAEGGWRQTNAGLDEPADSFTEVDLRGLSGSALARAQEEAADRIQASLDLQRGPVARAALFRRDDGDRLLLAIHHLAVDGVSWRVIPEDLEAAARAIAAGEPVALPPKTTSFRRWAQRMAAHARSEDLSKEASWWIAQGRRPAASVPVDRPAGRNTVASARSVDVVLTESETQALLQELPRVFRTQVNDALLTALAQAFRAWTQAPGLVVKLEGHGREDLVDGVDVSRTVGWFTSAFPLHLELDDATDAAASLKAVKEHLRAVPHRGVGYGLLRHHGEPEFARPLAAALEPEVSFNYLGQFDGAPAPRRLLAPDDGPRGREQAPAGMRSHVLDINGAVVRGRLGMSFTYSEELHERATVEAFAARFAEALRALAALAADPAAGGCTPSDFPLVRIDQRRLDAILAGRARDVESLYPLAPLQRGMLFHTLLEPSAGAYLQQAQFVVEGDLDERAFEKAWQRVTDHHAVLRTAFLWEGLAEPLQAVHARVAVPFLRVDLRGLPEAEQARRLDAMLAEDRARGFDLSTPPLSRILLARLGESRWHLVWTHHHLLLDGWSLPVLFRGLFACYDAYRTGREPELPRARPYADHVAWLARQDRGAAEAYWRQALAGFTAPTPLVVDRPLPATGAGAFDPAMAQVHLSEAATAALAAMARESRLTLSTLVQGAWSILLAKYSGEDDVVFGATVAGRPAALEGVESMVGLFINTLPVRARLAPETPVATWLKRLQSEQVDLRQYEYASLVDVQGWSDVPRGRHLFESILVFENYPVERATPDDAHRLSMRGVEVPERTSYPLTILAGPGERMLLRISYDRRRFDAPAIERMLGHLTSLLDAIARDPEAPIKDLSPLTAPEADALAALAAAQEPHPAALPIHEQFEAMAAAHPARVAVACGNDRLTYAELNARANQLAHHLRGFGVGAETPVALCLERGVDMVVAILGVLKAGGAYVPIDPAYPPERIAFMVEDTQAPVVLAHEPFVESIPPGPRVLALNGDAWLRIARERPDNLASGAAPESLAYVIYTSGSTGRPKGVLIEHRHVARLFTATDKWFGFGPQDVWTLFHSYAFDFSVWEIWGALLHGGRLVVVPLETARDPEAFHALLRRERVTVLNQTPSAFRQLARVDEAQAQDGLALRLVVFGGEALDPTTLRGWLARHGGEAPRLVNMYGITETTVHVTYRPIGAPDAETPDASPIGVPIADLTVHVLDGHGKPVPVGVPGEMYVGGAGVARGYLNRPELTAARFVPDPFSSVPGARLYRSGDLARRLPEGSLEYLGRIDHQVKIRGFRIELGEIENALLQHASVREAVALAREDAPGDKRIVAYLVLRHGDAPDVAALRAFLGATLPEYMIPSAFVALPALPLTSNGKVDRKALPAPDAQRPGLLGDALAARTPTEEILCGIWAAALAVDRVGVSDDFFALGGHSLVATQLVARVRETFAVDLPLSAFFTAPTVEALARAVDALRLQGQAPPPPLERKAGEGPAPLSHAQRRLWFLHKWEPESAAYHVPAALRLRGRLDRAALERALGEIVRRHEALRTTFGEQDGEPVQLVQPWTAFDLPQDDLSRGPGSGRLARAAAAARDEIARPFDLETSFPFRARLLRLDEDDHVLVTTFHHIAFDAWSAGVFLRELSAIYGAFARGEPSPLPELPVQYADHARWQRAHLDGPALDAQVERWRRRLADATPVDLPTDRPRPSVLTTRGGHVDAELPADVARRLRALAREEGATPFMPLLAAWQTLLHRYTGGDDVTVGSTLAGRGRQETDGLIGFFVNTHALRTSLAGDPTFRGLLARVRETCLAAYGDQDVPFERLVDELAADRDLSRTPFFQTILTLQPAGPARLDLSGLDATALPLESGTAKFDLNLSLSEGPQGLAASLGYRADLFDASTARRMLQHFANLLAAATADPDLRLSQIPMMSAAETREALVGGTEAQETFAPGLPLHKAFEARAAATPDAVALTFEGASLTYAELDARANRLAHRLARHGVKAETCVGLLAERSTDLVVGVLGILKAGAAYVPIDPAYPPERIAFMLEDTKAPVVVTQAPLEHLLPASLARVRLDADAPALQAEPPTPPAVGDVSPDALAYVIYTSGSTGKPKGVLVPHAAVGRLFSATDAWFGFGADDVWTLFHSIAFDFSVWELWGALLHGGRLVVVPRAIARDPELLHGLLRDERVSVLNQTPSAFKGLAHADEARPPGDLSLRLVVFGGEALDPAALRGWFARHGDEAPRLVNMYGITETTVHVTYRVVTAADAERGGISPIGVPIPDLRVHVLDAHRNPVPVGVPGEMYVGGAGVARGYLNRPELTAERFVPDTFSGRPHARLYRSGDLARRLPDGSLEYLGRIDQQVKIRGFRIELGEIESALATHPAVRQAAVLAREDAPGEKRLVAYVVPRGDRPDAGALRAHLQARLPEHMVPAAFVALDAIPLTSNGKVDRKALPAPEGARLEAERDFVPPSTDAEVALARIWSEVLRVDRVGATDDFFELGGDSILSLQVVARAARAGLRVTPKTLFQNATVAALARAAKRAPAIAAEQGPVTGPVATTPIQRWFLAQDLPARHHYNQATLLEAPADLDPAKLAAAVRALVEHHDALRLRLHGHGDAARFEIAPIDAAPPAVEECDLATTSAAEAAERAQAGLDLGRGPLVRVVLFHQGPGAPKRVLLVIHHVCVDGVSWRILLEDLETAYGCLARGEKVALPPKTTSILTWASRLAAHAHAASVVAQAPLWTEPDAEADAPLPRDAPGANATITQRQVSVALDAQATRAILTDVPKAWNARAEDAILAAVARAFAAWTGRRALRVHLEGHGREDVFEDVDVSRTVGWFTSLHPATLRLPAMRADDPGELILAVKEQVRAIPDRGFAHGLLRWLGPADAASRLSSRPAPEVSVNYLGQLDGAGAGEGAASARGTFVPIAGETGRAHSPVGMRVHLFDVSAAVSGGCLRLAISYSEATHARATAEALAAGMLDALQAIARRAADPGAARASPSDFPLVRIGQARLDALLDAHPGAEDVLPLSPMQQGMLFHTAFGDATGTYVEQVGLDVDGSLDDAALLAAWRHVLARHGALRAAFVWEGLDEPVQVIRGGLDLPVERHDWRDASAAEQEARLAALLRDDRTRGFDLARPPLMRLLLVRTGEERRKLVWSHHHVLVDGWSVSTVLWEVFTAYGALREGRQPALPASRPYRDHLSWLARQDRAKAEACWREELAGFEAPTPLPHDADADPADGTTGERRLDLPADASAALRAAARRLRVTPNTLVQGAWALALSRWSGERDVVFGATASGRPADLDGAERMVGLFINTLPVRVRVDPDAAVGEWLQGIQARAVDMRQHEHAPLATVQALAETPRGEPLFQSILVFENFPVQAAEAGTGARLAVRPFAAPERSNYPVALLAAPGERLVLKVYHDRSRVGDRMAARMLGHVRAILEAIAQDPTRPLGGIGLLSDAERAELSAWNATAMPVPEGDTVPAMVARAAARDPARVAVSAPGGSLTYAELDARADRIARALAAKGVKRGDVVAVLLERSPDFVATALGVMRAGAAYLPLDPATPRERVQFMLGDARAAAVVTQASLEPLAQGGAAPVLRLDGDALDACAAGALPRAAEPHDLAYVIYTSGSTGVPKGVMVEHAALVNLVAWHVATYGVTPDDHATQLAGLAFDASVWETWPILAAGATLHLPDEDARLDPAALVAWMADEGVTTAFAPTPLAERMVGQAWPAHARLRVLLTGGERLRRAPPAGLPFALVNHYGPTESTVVATAGLVPAGDARVPTIGRPIANTLVRVVDDAGHDAPVGVPGELWIGGRGLARGYLHRPELTAERFVERDGARWYRTGDLVRWTGAGELDYVGRADHQVKVRGHRIELGEVETALLKHEAVREAVALAREDAPGDVRLVAYLVPHGAAPATGELREHLKRTLPDAMVPSAFVMMDALPLTRNGKVDRKALPAPEGGRRDAASVAPRTRVEEALAAAWSEVLRTREVGVEDDYFELGGDSILAIQIVARAARRGIRVTPRQMFQHPTIAQLAAVATVAEAPAAEQGPVTGPVALTPVHRWHLARGLAEPNHFNQSVFVRVPQDVDRAALGRAWRALVEHHDALRTTFLREGDAWTARVQAPDASPAEVEVVDLYDSDAGTRRGVIEARATRAQASLDLAKAPLARAVLFDLGPEEDARLLLVAHHLVVDAVSWRILMEDLEAAYAAAAAGSDVKLPLKTTSFQRWADRLASHARASRELHEESDHWLRQAHDVRPLPRDHPDGENVSASARAVTVVLDEADTRALLADVPRAFRAGVADAMLAALAEAHAAWTGGRRVLVDLEGHGREDVIDADVSRTVGWFTSLHPLALDARPGGAVETLKAAKEAARATPRRGVGFGLLRWLGPPEIAQRLAALPEPEIALNYLGVTDGPRPAGEGARLVRGAAPESAGRSTSPRNARAHLIEVMGGVSQGRLTVAFQYSESAHKAETVRALADAFVAALREIAKRAADAEGREYTPSDFPLARLDQEQLDAVLRKLGGR